MSLIRGAHRTGADQLGALLGPRATASREHPRGSRISVVLVASHEGGVSVSGHRDGKSLECVAHCAGADQLAALLQE